MPKEKRKLPPHVTISVSPFVPKPFTPFQWEPQDTREQILHKQKLLLAHTTNRKLRLSWHQVDISQLEAVLARGDRRVGQAVYLAWKKGCHLDAWEEQFRFDWWEEAMQEAGLSMAFYANRRRSFDEVLPWSHLDYGIREDFLRRENLKAREAVTTPQCREQCSGCGANSFLPGGVCFE